MWPALAITHVVVAALASCHVVLQDKRPSVQLAWIFGIGTVPVIGAAAYALIGTDRLFLRRERRRARYRALDDPAYAVVGADPDETVVAGERAPMLRAWQRLNGVPPTRGNQVAILSDADHFYDDLARAIDSARRQLWVCFFAWRADDTGRYFLELLTAAAERGVEVRLLVDELGSRTTRTQMFDPLVAAGGSFSWATTLFPRRNRWFLNLRNHRKIVVVDGEEGYVGGMNIGDEYLFGVEGKTWNDLQIRVRGPAVRQMAGVFASDWHFATSQRLQPVGDAAPRDDGFPAQVIAGGPDSPLATNERSLQALIDGARERVLLTTPYFVPDDELLASLELAAARGVHVRLLVSAETDMGPLLLLSRSYFDRLLTAGVEISEYPVEIHHAKIILVDDDVALVGSINLDVRSFHLNYEISLAMIAPPVVASLEDYLDRQLGDCEPIDPEAFARRPLSHRLREGLLRLFAPLL